MNDEPTLDKVQLTDGLGLVPKRADYTQDVWECFCDMPKDGQTLLMLDVLMFGQACADKAQAAERKLSADVADSLLLGMPGHTAPHPIYLYRGNVGAAIRGRLTLELTGFDGTPAKSG